ncbi:MAG: hypothetical protein OWQ54_01940 [Sulfolobaceae archaeon]|nr:hypothetical protein [Sulfolobaceae archaeon]
MTLKRIKIGALGTGEVEQAIVTKQIQLADFLLALKVEALLSFR